jgi:hypothetical protein
VLGRVPQRNGLIGFFQVRWHQMKSHFKHGKSQHDSWEYLEALLYVCLRLVRDTNTKAALEHVRGQLHQAPHRR